MEPVFLRINSSRVVSETVDGAVIIIDLETGTYYQLVDSGADAWLLLEKGVSERQFVRAMCSYYSDDASAVEQSAIAFLQELKKEEIIVTDGGVDAGDELASPVDKRPMSKLQLEKFTNMSDLLLLDPIHDVNEQGWPHSKTARE